MEKKKILIVDDEEQFAQLMKLNLDATGLFEVVIQTISTKAIQTALDHRPDLILLDVIMPDLEGPDVAALVRENNILRNTPIIFLTAAIKPDEVAAYEGKIAGHTFLAKPTNVDEIIHCIQQHLQMSS